MSSGQESLWITGVGCSWNGAEHSMEHAPGVTHLRTKGAVVLVHSRPPVSGQG